MVTTRSIPLVEGDDDDAVHGCHDNHGDEVRRYVREHHEREEVRLGENTYRSERLTCVCTIMLTNMPIFL